METELNFWRSILSQIFIEHVMKYNLNVSFLIIVCEVYMLISTIN